jgi:hypothetical protein
MATHKRTGRGKLKRAKWASNYNAGRGLKHRRLARLKSRKDFQRRED